MLSCLEAQEIAVCVGLLGVAHFLRGEQFLLLFHLFVCLFSAWPLFYSLIKPLENLLHWGRGLCVLEVKLFLEAFWANLLSSE